MVASQFIAQYAHAFNFDTLDLSSTSSPVDITQQSQVQHAFENSTAAAVVHCAAYTNVTEAWKQQGKTDEPAYQVNVVGTKNVALAAAQTGKHLIHISTPYIFDGTLEGFYTEESLPSPIEWYGYTKAEAERVLQETTQNWTILRIDQPFRSLPFVRPDAVRRIVSGLKQRTLPPQFTDHTFGPTFLDDFSHVLNWAATAMPQGVFNASSGEKWTDYAFAEAVRKAFKLEVTVPKGSLSEYLAKSNRPYQRNTAMSTKKLAAAFKKLNTVAEALQILTKT